MHMIHKTLPTYEYDYTNNFDTQFRPLPEVAAYDTYFVDPQYARDPYWDEDLYDQTICSTRILTTNLKPKLKMTT